jgi:hypothetical protein
MFENRAIIDQIKEGEMDKASTIWKGQVRNAHKILVKNLKGRDRSEDLDIAARIILDWILRKYGGTLWAGFVWLRTGTSGRFYNMQGIY